MRSLGIKQTVNAQSATSITDVMTQTLEVQKTSNIINTNTTINNNNNPNAVWGSLFLTEEDRLRSYNRMNEITLRYQT